MQLINMINEDPTMVFLPVFMTDIIYYDQYLRCLSNSV